MGAIETPLEPVEITSALGSYLAGRHAQRQRDAGSAARFFEFALNKDPDNADLLLKTMMSKLADGEVTDAAGLANRLAAADSDSPIGLLLLAVHDIKLGDFAGAERWIESGPKVGFSQYMSHLLTAWTQLGQGNDAGAFERLEPLAGSSSFAMMKAYHTALLADLSGKPDLAETNYALALTAVRGGTLNVVRAAGIFYERTGKTDEARALYAGFAEANPDNVVFEKARVRLDNGGPTPDRPVDDATAGFAEALYGVALSLLQQNSYDPALSYARLAAHLVPESDAAWLLIGDIMLRLELPAEAVESYRRVARDSYLSWPVRLRLAGALDLVGDIDAAADELKIMASERPDRSDALISLGEMYRAKERYAEAVPAYDQAIDRIDTLEQRHWSLLYARGMSLERTDQWAEAEADFLRALELEPDQPFVLNYLGYSWVEMGRNLDRAKGMIERAVEQRPNDGYIVDSLGWVLYQLGDFPEALRHLERAVEIRPGDPVILDHFADVLWQVGRRAEARFQWERALSFEPDDDVADAIREKLKSGEPSRPKAADSEDL